MYKKNQMNICHFPLQDRPRERLLSQGTESLSNSELLAILLNHGTRGKNALDLARELLTHFKGLRGLLNADKHSFAQAPGLGNARYCQLQASLELTRRYLKEEITRADVITNAEQAEQFLSASLSHYEHEVFACLFLDVHNRVLGFERLFHGTISSATVHLREVIKRALHHNAAGIIAAHNHPSGCAEPSDADCELTHALKSALAMVDIHLLDHIVIGNGETVSLANRGLA